MAGDRVAHHLRPRCGQRGEWDRVATSTTTELALDLATDALHHRTWPGVTESA